MTNHTKPIANAVLTVATVLCAAMLAEPLRAQEPPEAQAQRMFYRPNPEITGHMWDVWLQVHEGKYYLYYLASSKDCVKPAFDSTSLAVSEDGVSWTEHGRVVPMTEDAVIMGSAGVWRTRSGEFPPYVMNLAERRRKEVGSVMFALGSDDLIHWTNLGSQYTFGPDPRWYEPKGRWVGISVIPNPAGGYYGYWTATPSREAGGLFGFGRSADGVSWEQLPPPQTEGLARGGVREIGGAAVINGKVYLLYCAGQGRMTLFVGDRPEGPFRIQEENQEVLFGHTHFARFAGGTEDPLVVHHIMTTSGLDTPPECYFAPIKRAIVDEEGVFRLVYWEGNERLKTKPVEVQVPEEAKQASGRFVMLDNRFDAECGFVLEGHFSNLKPGRFLALNQGLYVEWDDGRGTGLMVSRSGIIQIGTMREGGAEFRLDSFVNRRLPSGPNPKFRLMVRHSLLEFYLNDHLIQCHSLPGRATGRVGYIHDGNPEGIGQFKAWE